MLFSPEKPRLVGGNEFSDFSFLYRATLHFFLLFPLPHFYDGKSSVNDF